MKEYETVHVNVKDIKVDKDNPNVMDESTEKRLNKSMKEFGNTQDIIVDKNTMILADGEHRLRQYMKEGLKDIPVKLVDFKSDAHRRAYRQAANKIRGSHDSDLDAEEYLKIMNGGQKDLLRMVTGLSISEVENHLRRKNMLEKEEDFDVEKELGKVKNPVTKRGDIWVFGNHFLMCGDASKQKDVDKLMDGVSAQMVITDPPYGVNYSGTGNKNNTIMSNDQLQGSQLYDFLSNAFKNCSDNLNISGSIYVFHPGSQSDQKIIFENVFKKFFKKSSTLIWVKQNAGMGWQDYRVQHEPILYGWKNGSKKHKWYGGRDQTTVWEINKDAAADYEHPTQKPVELAIKAIENSTIKDDVVLDIFGGSGSTMIACEKLQRRCMVMEIDPKYCDVTIKRWEQFTGQKAVKESK